MLNRRDCACRPEPQENQGDADGPRRVENAACLDNHDAFLWKKKREAGKARLFLWKTLWIMWKWFVFLNAL